MNKRTLLISLLILPLAFLQAKTVDFQKAVDVAAKTLYEESSSKSGVSVSATPENRLILVKSASPENNYYVFNEAEGKGFVIISGDDVAKPVLGYSDKGNFDENNLPPALVYWLEFLNSEIAYAVQNNLPSNAEWENISDFRTANVIVEPLLTTTWDQAAPYNNLCPEINGYRTVTGCTATAMAQIMKYYNYPPNGTGQTRDYFIAKSSANVPEVDFGATNYDWENMRDYYDGVTTDIEKDAVATLMFHCGAAARMNYDIGTSGATTLSAAQGLASYFNYESTLMQKIRSDYSNSEWELILKSQLDMRRPVLYEGFNETVGHAFVCDGYNDEDKFHFNWGWGGSQDGYFVSTALNTISYHFNLNQKIIIDIVPNERGLPLLPIYLSNPGIYPATTTAVDRGELFILNSIVENQGILDFTGNWAIALVDDDDNILEIIGTYYHYYMGQAFNIYEHSKHPLYIYCQVSSDIAPGNYHIRTVAKSVGGEWTIVRCENETGCVDILNLTVNETIMPDNSSLVLYNDKKPAFVINPNPIQQGQPVSVQFGLFNHGPGNFLGTVSLGLYSNGELVELIDSKRFEIYYDEFFPSDSLYSWSSIHPTFSSSEILSEPGIYQLALYQKAPTGTLKMVDSYLSYFNIPYVNNIDIEVKSGIITAVAENEKSSILLYPNPAEDIVYISGEKVLFVEIKDLSGRIIKQSSETAISVKELQSGIYLFVIQTESGIVTKKVVKK